MNQRIVIDRLDLDLRSVDPALARQAVELLGPALQAALADGTGRAAPGASASPAAAAVDRRAVAAGAPPQALAAALAGHIAGRIATHRTAAGPGVGLDRAADLGRKD